MIYNIDRVLDAMSKILNEFSGLDEYAVQIVQCGECKHFKRDISCVGGTYNGCDQLEGRDGCELDVEEDFFCAYGERRTDETD